MACRVLVVEDEPDLAVTCQRLLRWQGHDVVSVGSRQAGLWAMCAEPFALVITDLRLPDGDGLDVVRAARATPRPTPVIVFTAFVSERSRRAALEAGAAAYLVKPFSVGAFTALVRKVLDAAVGAPAAPPSPAPSA